MIQTLPTIPIHIASRLRPSSYTCFQCGITPANFFVAKGSLKNLTEVVALCFQCYVHKRNGYGKYSKKTSTRIKRANNTV